VDVPLLHQVARRCRCLFSLACFVGTAFPPRHVDLCALHPRLPRPITSSAMSSFVCSGPTVGTLMRVVEAARSSRALCLVGFNLSWQQLPHVKNGSRILGWWCTANRYEALAVGGAVTTDDCWRRLLCYGGVRGQTLWANPTSRVSLLETEDLARQRTRVHSCGNAPTCKWIFRRIL
jgi:hypothetical protein